MNLPVNKEKSKRRRKATNNNKKNAREDIGETNDCQRVDRRLSGRIKRVTNENCGETRREFSIMSA